MELRMPTFDLPWARKSRLERTQAELQKLQKTVQKQAARVELPRISMPTRRQGISGMIDDARATVGETVEQLADTVTSGAADLTHDAGKLGREAGKRGRGLAAASDDNLRALTDDLRAVGSDVRSLRVTREKRGADVMPGIALLAGLGTGLAAMYFFDPEQGRRRRALLRDQLVKWSRVTRETLDGQARDLRNRGIGLVHEVRRGVGDASEGNGAGATRGSDIALDTPDASTDLATTDSMATDPLAVGQPPVGQALGSERMDTVGGGSELSDSDVLGVDRTGTSSTEREI